MVNESTAEFVCKGGDSPGSTVTVPDAGGGAVHDVNLVVNMPLSPTSRDCLESISSPL